jgi:uncharacterized membrane protein YdcZ (DUF606 family)
MSDDQRARDGQETPERPAWFRRTPRGPLGWIVIFTRGLVFDQHLRRVTMFYVVLAAMFMALAGDVVFEGWLGGREHLLRFVLYWLGCALLTILAALLAIYDLLMLRIQHRLLRKKLRARMLGEETDKDPHE